MTSIISYNVNGIRAAAQKGLVTWIQESGADIVCLQETKAQPDQVSAELIAPPGFYGFWHSAEKKGYSGVAIYTRREPLHVETGCGIDWVDQEGRVLRADYEDFSVVSLYVPSGSSGEDRQGVKDKFMIEFLPYLKDLKERFPRLIVCGDYNVAHQPIDIHNPKSNKDSSGFLPHERAWFDDILALGYKDSFRMFHPEAKDEYSWWSFRFNSRASNKGWRIDYHLVSEAIADDCLDARILQQVVHSDHCPIQLTLK